MGYIWILASLCAIIGALVSTLGIAFAESAPQEAAAAAVGLAWAAIHYCLARAFSEIGKLPRD